MSDERSRTKATITRGHGEQICVTDIVSGRTVVITIRGGPVKLECDFPAGMLVRRAELLDEAASVGVES